VTSLQAEERHGFVGRKDQPYWEATVTDLRSKFMVQNALGRRTTDLAVRSLSGARSRLRDPYRVLLTPEGRRWMWTWRLLLKASCSTSPPESTRSEATQWISDRPGRTVYLYRPASTSFLSQGHAMTRVCPSSACPPSAWASVGECVAPMKITPKEQQGGLDFRLLLSTVFC
jgi:hypothetical protein